MKVMQLPADAHTVISLAEILGGKAYIVGGAVRDHVMGFTPKDFDMEIHGLESLDQLATSLKVLGRVDEVGVSFSVLKFGADIDISLPRRDSKVGSGHTGFVVEVDPHMGLPEALSRRDFTICSMAYDPITGEIIDPFGGLADIESKILRHTSEAFAEDPLRVLRGVRFASRFGFRLAPETAVLCQSLMTEFSTLAKERVWGELFGIISKGVHFGAMFQALADSGWVQFFPEFVSQTGHEEGHTASLTDPGETRAALILGLWLTRMPGDRRSVFLSRLDVPQTLRRRATAFCEAFMIATSVHPLSMPWIRSVARRLGDESVATMAKMICVPTEFQRILLAAIVAGCWESCPPPLVTGHSLIELGFTPGPEFGPILKVALTAQDRGEFTTREEAMVLAQSGAFGKVEKS